MNHKAHARTYPHKLYGISGSLEFFYTLTHSIKVVDCTTYSPAYTFEALYPAFEHFHFFGGRRYNILYHPSHILVHEVCDPVRHTYHHLFVLFDILADLGLHPYQGVVEVLDIPA